MLTTDDHGDAHEDAHDDDDHEHNLELAPAAVLPTLVLEILTSDVYRSTALEFIPGASVVLHHGPVDPSVAAMVHTSSLPSANELTVLHKSTTVTVREVDVVPGITLEYLSMADYIFFTSQLPIIVEEH